MARVQIDLPEHFPFETRIVLYQSHINFAGHLDNAQVLSVVSEARSRYIRALGFSEMDVEGCGLIVADAALQYRSEAFHGEEMRVEMGATDFHPKGCDLVWRMSENHSGREVARGKTGILVFDYTQRKVVAMPARLRQALGAPD